MPNDTATQSLVERCYMDLFHSSNLSRAQRLLVIESYFAQAAKEAISCYDKAMRNKENDEDGIDE